MRLTTIFGIWLYRIPTYDSQIEESFEKAMEQHLQVGTRNLYGIAQSIGYEPHMEKFATKLQAGSVGKTSRNDLKKKIRKLRKDYLAQEKNKPLT